MVFNAKLILLIVGMVLIILGFGYVSFNLYADLKATESKLQETIELNKQIRSAYNDELEEQRNLNNYKVKVERKIVKEYVNAPCVNDSMPDDIVDSLYYRKK